MMQLWEFAYWSRLLRARMQFGQLSRAPLTFLHIEVRNEQARCDWIARTPDPWDDDLPEDVQARRASLQALEDAMMIRQMLFLALPRVKRADLRSFRARDNDLPELIIEGSVSKDVEPPRRIASVAMRAVSAGFRFWLQDGILRALDAAEPAFAYAT